MVVRRIGLAALAAASLAMSGCVTNSASVYIAGAVPIDSSSCTYAVATSVGSAGTSVDVNIAARGGSVTVGFVVNSLLRQRTFSIATDPSTVVIEEAEITLTDAAGAAVGGGSYIVDVAGAVIPGSADGIAPGTGVVAVPIIPPSVLTTFAGTASTTTLVAAITLRGRTIGNIEVEGGEYRWLVNLLPAGAKAVACGMEESIPCCNPGQDDELYCNDKPGCAPN